MRRDQIKIILSDIQPPIWRRVLLSPEITLDKLHRILQTVMGWEDAHMHRFVKDGRTYSDPHFELEDDVHNEQKAMLRDILTEPGTRMIYEYDFGDGWRHELLCEEIVESEEQSPHATCINGARACPPEDCGGPDAYIDLLRVLKNPKHREYEEMRDWVGSQFDPEAFNLEVVNERLSRGLRRKQ